MDLIQSEYGWQDNVVLDLPICRLRQIVSNIEFRAREQRRYEKTITEWQTRTIVQFIAASVPVEKGHKNPLAAAADKVSLRLDDEGNADDTPMETYIEEGSQTAENAPGSFERLMGGFRG